MESEWIDIKQRKPPNDVYVLVTIFDHRPKMMMAHVEIAARMGKQWVYPKDGEVLNLKYGCVTHWMSIPDPATHWVALPDNDNDDERE